MSGARRASWQGTKWCRPSTRLAIYSRDGFCCAYCGAAAEDAKVLLTLDHLVPVEHGGSNDPSNLVTACRSCNSRKQDRTVRAWYAVLRAEGADVERIGRRVRRLVARKLDRAEGRRLLGLRKQDGGEK